MEDALSLNSQISRVSQALNLEIQQKNRMQDDMKANRDLTHIASSEEMLMPAYSTYDAVTNLDTIDTNVKKRADIRDINVDEALKSQQVQKNGEINLENLMNTDALVERVTDENYASKEFVKTKVQTKSHRWGKTKKDRMKTSAKKLHGVSTKIANLKKKQTDTKKVLTRDERLAAYEDIYSEIHSSDRYYAEGMATTENEEKYIKVRADITYINNMLILYLNEASYAREKKREIEKRIKERKAGEETEHQIEADQKDLAYWTKRQQTYEAKQKELNLKSADLSKKLSRLNAKL